MKEDKQSNTIAGSVARARKNLLNARSEYRVVVLVAVGMLASYAFTTGCTWGWADNNCNDSNCVGACSNGSTVVLTNTYCQTQGGGLYCCQCTEVVYRCVTHGPCLTSFNYDRTRFESLESSCASGEFGLECIF